MAGIEVIELRDGTIGFVERLFSAAENERWFAALRDRTAWRQEEIRIFGRIRRQPRLTAWHGDPGAAYRYSGLLLRPEPWTADLLAVRERIEAVSEARFNSALLNYYRNGQDSMGWHSDDEPELGENPVIGAVSLGAARRFRMRHKAVPGLQMALDLPGGSYFEMGGALQRHWRHCVPKVASKMGVGPRINLTFRRILRTGVRP